MAQVMPLISNSMSLPWYLVMLMSKPDLKDSKSNAWSMPAAMYWLAAIVLLVCERVEEGVCGGGEEERVSDWCDMIGACTMVRIKASKNG